MQKTRFSGARNRKAPAGKERRRGYQSVAVRKGLVASPRFLRGGLLQAGCKKQGSLAYGTEELWRTEGKSPRRQRTPARLPKRGGEEGFGSLPALFAGGAFASGMQKTRFFGIQNRRAPAGKERRRGYQSMAMGKGLVASPRFLRGGLLRAGCKKQGSLAHETEEPPPARNAGEATKASRWGKVW